MTQFLPPISAITRFTWPWPVGVSAAARTISSPTAPEPVKAIRFTRGSRTSAAPASPSPGSSAERGRRHPGAVQRLDQRQRAAGRLLGRLQHHRVARRQRGGGHPGRDREREVPRRDHRRDAERLVAHRVALAGRLGELGRVVELGRAARVVLEEVDRLADVGVRLRPTASRTRGPAARRARAGALAQRRGGGAQDGAALGAAAPAPLGGAARPPPRPPAAAAAASALPGDWRPLGSGRRDRSTRARRRPRRRRRSGPGPRAAAAGRARRARPAAVADVRPAQLQRRLVGEGIAHGAASSSSTGAPPWCARRNESLEVFSSRRRTR